MEIFKMPDVDGYYITKDGKIFKEINGRETTGGYMSAHLRSGNDYKIHRLVAKTFIPNPGNLPQVTIKMVIRKTTMLIIWSGVQVVRILNMHMTLD